MKTIKELEDEINNNNWKRHDRDIKITILKDVLKLIDEFKDDVERAGLDDLKSQGYYSALKDLEKQIKGAEKWTTQHLKNFI